MDLPRGLGGAGADLRLRAIVALAAPRNAAGGYADVHAFFDNIAVYPGERTRPRPGA